MATKKKASPKKSGRKSSAARTIPMRNPDLELQASKKVQTLVVLFTVLSVVFACTAFWRYG